jgi:hypothetical protein
LLLQFSSFEILAQLIVAAIQICIENHHAGAFWGILRDYVTTEWQAILFVERLAKAGSIAVVAYIDNYVLGHWPSFRN